MTEIEKYDRWQEQHDVMELFVQNKNATQIAKELDIPRTRVKEAIQVWKESTAGSQFLQERVEELLTLTDEHYSKLIRTGWDVIEEIDASLQAAGDRESKDSVAGLLGQKTNALDKIANWESKRIDMLQKAGLLEAADLGDQFAEQEEKQQELLNILREVSYDCDRCKIEVSRRLAILLGKPEPIYDDVVEGEVVKVG
jgi:hypothetical protein